MTVLGKIGATALITPRTLASMLLASVLMVSCALDIVGGIIGVATSGQESQGGVDDSDQWSDRNNR